MEVSTESMVAWLDITCELTSPFLMDPDAMSMDFTVSSLICVPRIPVVPIINSRLLKLLIAALSL